MLFNGIQNRRSSVCCQKLQRPSSSLGVALSILFWHTERINCFVRQSTTVKMQGWRSSVEDFLPFSSEIKSCPNLIYMCSQITNYTFAIINFRMTLRRNNLKLVQSAAYKLSDMFYGRFHPFYQLIEIHFLAQMFTIHEDFATHSPSHFHLIHFIYQSSSHSFYVPKSNSFISSFISISFILHIIVYLIHIYRIWFYSYCIVFQPQCVFHFFNQSRLWKLGASSDKI